MKPIFTLILLFCLSTDVISGAGESAVITLIFPYGARSCGMAEAGTSLADDESALYFNPAGLGIRNKRWDGGSGSYFFERLLPYFGFKDLWHAAATSYYQPQPSSRIGGFGAFWNYINMGEHTIGDYNNYKVVHSYEYVVALGWGFNFAEFGDTNRYYGVTIKPFVSALAPGMGPDDEGVFNGVAFDIGYLHLLPGGLRFGFTLMNMGAPVFYVNHGNRDPLPFEVNCAIGYKKTLYDGNIHYLDIAAELKLDKELVINNFNGKPEPFFTAAYKEFFDQPPKEEFHEILIHQGVELCVLNTISGRYGFLFDYAGERYEMTWGFGINLFNHIRFDFSDIYSPEFFMRPFLQKFDKEKQGATGLRDRQWRINFTLSGIANVKKEDLTWWEKQGEK